MKENSIPAKIIQLIQFSNMPIGSHLSAQYLANELQVSRSPINDALSLLEDKGVVKRELNRGYFLVKKSNEPFEEWITKLGLNQKDIVSSAYFQLAEDRLRGLLPDEFSESQIRKRYHLTTAQQRSLLSRISEEGWAHKKPGYGWIFSPMLTTPEALIQSYRFRMALEPSALLEPGYSLDKQIISRLKKTEGFFLEGGIETCSADQIYLRGVHFHISLMEGTGNPFFIDAINRLHRVRRLLSYRSVQDRKRYEQQCLQHISILDLLEKSKYKEASVVLRKHFMSTIDNLIKIKKLLRQPS